MVSKQKRGRKFLPPLCKELEVRSPAQTDDVIEIKDSINSLKSQIQQLNFKLQNLEKMVNQKCDRSDTSDINSKEVSKELNVFSEAMQKMDKRFIEVQDLAMNLQEKIKYADLKARKAEDLADKLQNELAMARYFSTQKALRLRGIMERPKEDLKGICSKILAKLMEIKEEEITCRISKIYRVNSWMAKQNSWPRDIVIYFTETKIRNDIASRSYHTKMYVAGRGIKIFKEIPARILWLRKDFRFLADELKKRAIWFRWDAPVGMSFKYNGQYYKLDTIQKARAFYLDVLKVENTSSSRFLLELKQEEHPVSKEAEIDQEMRSSSAGSEEEPQSGVSDDEEVLDEIQSTSDQNEEFDRELFLEKVKSGVEALFEQFKTPSMPLE